VDIEGLAVERIRELTKDVLTVNRPFVWKVGSAADGLKASSIIAYALLSRVFAAL
jgi:hypothetical protein